MSKSEKVFTDIYEQKIWKKEANSDESHSGEGSLISTTQPLRHFLPALIRLLKIKTFADVACGDFNWMQHVDLNNVEYLGLDVVKQLIETNNKKYKHTFKYFDILTETLSKVDMILCRDCLVHFSFSDGWKAINSIKRSQSTYLLTTTFTNRKHNYNVETGDWTQRSLELPPFNFPEPLTIFNEGCQENYPNNIDKSLGLWNISDLPEESQC